MEKFGNHIIGFCYCNKVNGPPRPVARVNSSLLQVPCLKLLQQLKKLREPFIPSFSTYLFSVMGLLEDTADYSWMVKY